MNDGRASNSTRPASGEFAVPSEFQGLEAQLAALRPREDRLDRERLMFLAGRASALDSQDSRIRPRWLMPASVGALAASAAVLVLTATRGVQPLHDAPPIDSLASHGAAFAEAEDSGRSQDTDVLTAGLRSSRLEDVLAAAWRTSPPVANELAGDLSGAVEPRPMLSTRSWNDVL